MLMLIYAKSVLKRRRDIMSTIYKEYKEVRNLYKSFRNFGVDNKNNVIKQSVVRNLQSLNNNDFIDQGIFTFDKNKIKI
jgi:hypothetical protein